MERIQWHTLDTLEACIGILRVTSLPPSASFTLSAAALLLSCPTDASDRLWDLMWLLPTRPLRNLMWLLLKRTTATQPGDELRATKPALRAC